MRCARARRARRSAGQRHRRSARDRRALRLARRRCGSRSCRAAANARTPTPNGSPRSPTALRERVPGVAAVLSIAPGLDRGALRADVRALSRARGVWRGGDRRHPRRRDARDRPSRDGERSGRGERRAGRGARTRRRPAAAAGTACVRNGLLGRRDADRAGRAGRGRPTRSWRCSDDPARLARMGAVGPRTHGPGRAAPRDRARDRRLARAGRMSAADRTVVGGDRVHVRRDPALRHVRRARSAARCRSRRSSRLAGRDRDRLAMLVAAAICAWGAFRRPAPRRIVLAQLLAGAAIVLAALLGFDPQTGLRARHHRARDGRRRHRRLRLFAAAGRDAHDRDRARSRRRTLAALAALVMLVTRTPARALRLRQRPRRRHLPQPERTRGVSARRARSRRRRRGLRRGTSRCALLAGRHADRRRARARRDVFALGIRRGASPGALFFAVLVGRPARVDRARRRRDRGARCSCSGPGKAHHNPRDDTSRVVAWTTGVRTWLAFPLTGVGPLAFRRTYDVLRPPEAPGGDAPVAFDPHSLPLAYLRRVGLARLRRAARGAGRSTCARFRAALRGGRSRAGARSSTRSRAAWSRSTCTC